MKVSHLNHPASGPEKGNTMPLSYTPSVKEILPKLNQLTNKTILIKIGGDALRSEDSFEIIAEDMAALTQLGLKIIVVHGGGPQATQLGNELGHKAKIVGGRRVTDRKTLDIMKMAVSGLVNTNICAALVRNGARPIGLSGISGNLILAHRRPPIVVSGGGPDPIDFGHVGVVDSVNTELLNLLTEQGYLPVIACLAADQKGHIYNINADTVASQIAIFIKAASLVALTGVPGVLRDAKDPTTRFEILTADGAKQAIEQGIIQGGMIPKIEENLKILSQGVNSVLILKIERPGDLLRSVLTDKLAGTRLTLG